MTFNLEDSPLVKADPSLAKPYPPISQEQCETERLTNCKLEHLRQAQNEAVAYFQKLNPKLQILKH